MQIWPAIDLRGGRCVRLVQGDYNRETVYAEDPVTVARKWVDHGAQHLHLVDLDGARDGRPVNRSSVSAIVKAVDVPCELGGGIRNERTIDELLGMGLQRLVIGTLALKQPAWFRQTCEKFPHRLVLGIDARDGYVATDGWLETSACRATELAGQFDGVPLAAVIYTDISTDGTLGGPNVAAMREMREAVALDVVASGGVSCAADIEQLARIPMAGCIVGKALYEGTITLADAHAAARSPAAGQRELP
jgi:phosphoribosylformimino-5-aminoimidazole carboxamide ribotide isomerase